MAQANPRANAETNRGSPIDPAPRRYPAFVTLLRRRSFDKAELGTQTLEDTERWLLTGANLETDLLELFQSFAWRLVASGLAIKRASLHVGTLHPQFFGYAWNWEHDDGFCDEVKVGDTGPQTEAFRSNPLFRVIEHGEMVRERLAGRSEELPSPLLRDLAAKGFTDYAALPLNAGGAYHNAATIATMAPGGFTDAQFSTILRLLQILALHVARHIALRIAENVATTYLGEDAGTHVLDGSIKRGSGAAIDAVIWASDLRGFTQLADRLDDRELTAVLNAYFDVLAGSVLTHGGDVLKFIGDGLLAVFPFSGFDSEAAAADAAISAAEAALGELSKLNADPEALAGIKGWRPLKTGIALHRGKAFFGNVGAPQRLDFTVIGKAVNAAARIEALCKTTGRDLLVAEPVAELSKRDLESVGSFDLRGLEQPVALYSLPGR